MRYKNSKTEREEDIEIDIDIDIYSHQRCISPLTPCICTIPLPNCTQSKSVQPVE